LLNLSQSRLGSGDVTPLLDNRLLDLSGVLSGSGADLLGDINTFLLGLQDGHQGSHMLALTLGLEVASLLGNLLNDSLLLVKALFGSGSQDTSGRTAKLSGHLLTLGLGSVFLDSLSLVGTDLSGPLGTLLLGGVTLGDIFALLLLDGLAVDHIILDFVFVISGLALGLVDSLTLLGTLTFAHQRGVAEPDGLIEGNLLVVDETLLLEGLVTFFLLLGLEVGGVGGVAPLGVAMVAFDLLIVFGFFNHHDLIDTTLSSSGNGSNVKCDIISRSLT